MLGNFIPDLSQAWKFYSKLVTGLIILFQACHRHGNFIPNLSQAWKFYSKLVTGLIILFQACHRHGNFIPNLSQARKLYSKLVTGLVILFQACRRHGNSIPSLSHASLEQSYTENQACYMSVTGLCLKISTKTYLTQASHWHVTCLPLYSFFHKGKNSISNKV